MSRQTPSFQALHVFVTVVDAGSIREAAERLHRTESAVSHQLRTLERQLDAPLIERLRRGIRPTALGARYAERLAGPFAEIDRATQQLFEPAARRSISVTLSPVLASLWLVPRLADFEAAFDNLSLRLVTTDRWLDLARDGVDIAIRYHARRPAHSANRLFIERGFPVCSPAVATTEDAMRRALAEGRILINQAQADEWRLWRAALAEPLELSRRRERLADSNLTLEAAAQGYGIAMGREPLVSDLLQRGRLVAPLGLDFPTGGAYELRIRDGSSAPDVRERVAAWLGEALAEAMVTVRPDGIGD
ncbi:LysR family transcriptional regulator [uncultured Salinisphaera sp.]|uniref:LysR family transcriptional regulator n=1 Tax=uncultured Salinisphaera sp. TaxID=359372 RepID=UPI0032B2CC6E